MTLRNPIASNAFGSPTVSVTIREKPKGSTVLDLIPCFGDVVRRGGHDWQASACQVNYEGTQNNWCIAQFGCKCTFMGLCPVGGKNSDDESFPRASRLIAFARPTSRPEQCLKSVDRLG